MPDEDINPRAAKKFDLSKKVGPFPLYVWVASGVALLAGTYFLWKKHTASSTAATTPAATTTATGTTTGTGATGTGYQQYWPTTPSAPVTVAPTAEGATVANETNANSLGYGPTAYGSPVTDASGNVYTPFTNANTAWAFLNGGGQIYWQPTPGAFQPLTSAQWSALESSTPAGGYTPVFSLSQAASGSGGGPRTQSRPLSVLGHMIRNGARSTA
jgi:hypothetical protein